MDSICSGNIMKTEIETDSNSAVAELSDIELARLKVLIIDDEPVDREIFKQFLDSDRRGTFAYAEAGTGRDGLRMMETFHPDCILLDFNLPDLDGLTMIRMLHDGREFLPCAVVMLTGNGNEKVAVEAMKLGVMDYMAKGPASGDALSRTVASAVQRFQFQQEIARQRIALEQRNRELEAIRTELFEEKERYRVLAEAIPQLVWTADSNGFIHFGNQRLWNFSGKTNARFWPIDGLIHPEDRETFRQKWTDAVASGLAFETELRLERAKDQTWRRHLLKAVPIPASEGGPVRWFGTFTDIEDQKHAEEALRRREKLASIGVLAGGVAHDFNNLLAGIMGGTSFVLGTMDTKDPAYSMLEIVLHSSERAAVLTQQLLAYSGQVQFPLKPGDISTIVRDSCNRVRDSIPSNVRLAVECADNIPLVETNPDHVQQIVANLVVNAAEAIGEADGVITVRIAMMRIGASSPGSQKLPNVLGYDLPSGDYVSIEVSDSGPGMDEQMLTRIFDPFFTTKFTGRGLGLAVVQGVVRSFRGSIRVVSTPGEGSTFTVLLPRKEAAHGTAA